MNWKGFLWMALIVWGCGSDEEKADGQLQGGSAFQKFLSYFPEKELPFAIADTSLKDGNTNIPVGEVASFVPDSIGQQAPGRSNKLSYQALARLQATGGHTFVVLQTTKGSTRAAYLLVYNQNGQFAGSLPFLVPSDKLVRQVSSIDKNFSITCNTLQKKGNEIIAEGKNIFAWNAASQSFTWVMTDPLKEDETVVNPLDTFPQRHKFSGDYVKDKKNVVFIRDGRYANQLQVFIHMEKNNGECKGELKGNFIVTSSNTAVYREAGDPCVLQLKFAGSSVSLEEQQGCGNYRGLDCPLEGSFKKRKKTSTAAEK